jgi:hypothetical protein
MQPRNATVASTRTKRGSALKVLEVVLGLGFWVAFVLMFFTEKHPALKPYVTWAFRAYAAAMISFLLGLVLYGLFLSAREAVSTYHTIVDPLRLGLIGRGLWAFFFVIMFLVSLVFARF